MTEHSAVFTEIAFEREYQDQKWGGASHDDRHNVNDWLAFMLPYMGKASKASWELPPEEALAVFRVNMIKVAALAVAAIEAVDRYGNGASGGTSTQAPGEK